MSNKYNDERERLFKWFFKEYNAQFINYNKYYIASYYYKKRATQIRWGTGIVSSLVVIFVLGIIQGFYSEILTTAAIVFALLTGVVSLVGSIGDYQRNQIIYYRAGQEHDDLFSKFDKTIKVDFLNPATDLEDLEQKCGKLIDKKDSLNRTTPPAGERWYKKLIEEKGEDEVHWEIPSLEEMAEAQY